MIRIANKILSDINNHVTAKFLNAECVGNYVPTPSVFPHVCVTEDNNYTHTRSQDTGGKERNAVLLYTVNVYSASNVGKKEEAYSIGEIIDEYMQSIGFTRTMMNPVPNQDKNIYRLTMRYKAVVATGEKIGNDTVYRIYRN